VNDYRQQSTWSHRRVQPLFLSFQASETIFLLLRAGCKDRVLHSGRGNIEEHRLHGTRVEWNASVHSNPGSLDWRKLKRLLTYLGFVRDRIGQKSVSLHRCLGCEIKKCVASAKHRLPSVKRGNITCRKKAGPVVKPTTKFSVWKFSMHLAECPENDWSTHLYTSFHPSFGMSPTHLRTKEVARVVAVRNRGGVFRLPCGLRIFVALTNEVPMCFSSN
jgi:hypothetical protein